MYNYLMKDSQELIVWILLIFYTAITVSTFFLSILFILSLVTLKFPT